MMITLTPEDFRKLSLPCQREIITLLGFDSGETTWTGSSPEFYGEDLEFMPEESFQPQYDASDNASGSKFVVDITLEQAKALIANISDKSVNTLKLFASDAPIDIDDLVGDGKAYENFTDLKRSFVGAVNRRLRTVKKNKRAVLFRSVKSDDNPDQPMISVRPDTATALKELFAGRD